MVIVVGSFGATYLGTMDDSTTDGPLVDARIDTTADRIMITHASGERVAVDHLDVLVRNDDSSQRFSFDAADLTDDDSDVSFEPSERFRRDHDVGGGQLEVLLIHTDSNAVIEQVYPGI